MPINITCTGCGMDLKVRDELAGKRAKCPRCGLMVAVPAASPGGEPGQVLENLEEWAAYRRPGRYKPPWRALAGAAAGGILIVVVLALVLSAGKRSAPEGGGAAGAPAPSEREARRVTPSSAPPGWALPQPLGSAGPPAAAPPAGMGARESGEVVIVPSESEQQAPPTGSPCPSGPLVGAPAEQVSKVLAAFVAEAMPLEWRGVTMLQPGERLAVTLDGRRYEGRLLRQCMVTAVEAGKPSAKELRVLTTGPWALTDEAFLPEDTCVTYKDGSIEVTELGTLKAEAEQRDAYVAKVIARVDAAVNEDAWERADALVAEGLQKYPDSLALQRRVQRLGEDRVSARLVLENRGQYKLGVALKQGGATVMDVWLGPNTVKEARVRKGQYSGYWYYRLAGTTEEVSVSRSERWVFTLAAKQEVSTLEPVLAWRRAAQPLRPPRTRGVGER